MFSGCILDGGRHALCQAGFPVEGPEPGMRLDVCYASTQVAKPFAQVCLHAHQYESKLHQDHLSDQCQRLNSVENVSPEAISGPNLLRRWESMLER